MVDGRNDWAEYNRRLWTQPYGERFVRPDAARHMRPDAERYTRPDGNRFLQPWVQERKQVAAPPQEDAQRDWEIERAEHRLRCEIADFKLQLALLRFGFRRTKAFDPNQPRVPAGNSDGGQWTREGVAEGRIQVAGPLPSGDPPEVPKERPPTEKERNRVAQRVSREPRFRDLRTAILSGAVHWIAEKFYEIKADQDPPKTLEELHDAASNPKRGYDVHHIVLKKSAKDDGFPNELINGRDNLVLIPRYQHWRINRWYETSNKDFGNQTPREALSGMTWVERRSLGLKVLADFGVLKP